LKRLHQRLKTTTIYVTHDQEEAMTLGDRIVVMKDGRIQQADSPLETYLRPANRFVAGFIGMPPMNFFEGMLKSVEGRLSFEEDGAGGFSLPLSGPLQDRLAGHAGRKVVVGVRPEHLQLKPAGGGAETSPLRGTVSVVELLGRDMDVYLRTATKDGIVARLEAGGGLAPEMAVTLHVDPDKAQVFEPGETGVNLRVAGQRVAAAV
jgi:multiple sugar transport system ATP-binding protein